MGLGSAPPGGTLAALVAAVLNFAQDWRRAVILVVLGGCALGGTLVYQGRDRLLAGFEELVREPPRARLEPAVAPPVAAELLATIPGAPRMVAVWAVDVQHNRQTLVALAAVPDAAAALEPLGPRLRAGIPFLSASRGQNTIAIALLNGALGCGQPTLEGPERAALAAAGVTTLCAIGVPPEAGELVGAVLVGFAAPVEPWALETARPLLWAAANRLVGRGGG